MISSNNLGIWLNRVYRILDDSMICPKFIRKMYLFGLLFHPSARTIMVLSIIIHNEAIIKDSFAFVEELQSLPASTSEYKMVSFDIASLYTNISLDETIQIILNYLYDIQAPPTGAIKRKDMEKLLKFATKNSHFLFNGKVYDQKDGVSMGSPLAPLLAEIFLQDFEKKHLPSFKKMGIVYWKRYVDDTFVLLDPKFSTKDICNKLSQCHPALKFTVEKEILPTEEGIKKIRYNIVNYYSKKNEVANIEEDTFSNTYLLSFLDVLIQRRPGIDFKTQVHRKDTFSDLITKWNSFVPQSYKYNAISSMVYRARKLCSTYPFAPRTIKPALPETDIVLLRVPYYGKPSQNGTSCL